MSKVIVIDPKKITEFLKVIESMKRRPSPVQLAGESDDPDRDTASEED